MKNSSHQDQDPDSIGLEILAQLSIYVESQHETVSFACDWINNDTGIEYISNIIYSLKYDDLLEKILKGLRKQCVLNDNLEEYNKIMNRVNEISQKNKKSDEVVIKATDISKLQ